LRAWPAALMTAPGPRHRTAIWRELDRRASIHVGRLPGERAEPPEGRAWRVAARFPNAVRSALV